MWLAKGHWTACVAVVVVGCAQRVFEEDEVTADDDGETKDAAAADENANKPMNPEDMLAMYKTAVSAGSAGLHFYQTFTEDGALEVANTENAFDGQPLPFIIGTRDWMTDENVGLAIGTLCRVVVMCQAPL